MSRRQAFERRNSIGASIGGTVARTVQQIECLGVCPKGYAALSRSSSYKPPALPEVADSSHRIIGRKVENLRRF